MIHLRLLASMLVASTLLAAGPAAADDWPRWRGADGTGISAESGWTDRGRDEAPWSRNVGLGYTSFVVRDGRVLTAGFDKASERDTIFCLDAATGAELWTYSFPAKLWDKFHTGGTLSTPVFDGDRVYGLSREGRAYCLKVDDGALVWQRDLKEEFELTYPEWMFSASPLVDGDAVILNVGRVVALDKASGSTRWATRPTGDAYSTPQPFEAGGRPAMAVFNSEGLVVFDRTDGTEIAAHSWRTKYDINAATPIILDDRIFISSGQNRGCALLELTDAGLEVVWEKKLMSTKMTGCVLVDDHLYGFDDAILQCLDLDGNERWRKRGLGMGTLMAADGRLIIMSAKGELIVATATPDAYTERSRTKVLEGGVYWTMPILANGLIYCRNSEGDVVCRDHRPTSEVSRSGDAG
jgi:outer membrane protein assembly factor BamB